MTKERLEELIKQKVKKKLWSINFFIYDLENCHIEDGVLMDDTEHTWCNFENLYETKEQAEWALKTVAIRTERFEPPMWEDIKNTYGFRFIYYDDIIEFTVNYSTMLDGVEFNTQKIVIRNLDERELLFVKPATKENYEKACEIVRDLFKGEK